MTRDECVHKLVEVSGRKYSLLTDMLDLTKRQTASINEDDLDVLQKIIDDKQAIINSIDKLDDEFEACFKKLKSELKIDRLDELKDRLGDLKNFSAIERLGELQEIIAKIMHLTREISEIEKINGEKAKDLFEKLGSEIEKINQARMLKSAYSPQMPKPPSFFIDKKR